MAGVNGTGAPPADQNGAKPQVPAAEGGYLSGGESDTYDSDLEDAEDFWQELEHYSLLDLLGSDEWVDQFRGAVGKWTQSVERARERSKREAQRRMQTLTEHKDRQIGQLKQRIKSSFPKAEERIKVPLDVLERRVRRIESKLHEPRWVHRREKWAFLLGVTNLWMTAVVVGAFPQYMTTWYTLRCALLLSARYASYKPAKYHYFLADFCYLANALVILYVYALPYLRPLFIAMYCLTNGPLAWAIVTWNNAMVFHSADKVTSVFIHVAPALLMFTLRYLIAPTLGDDTQRRLPYDTPIGLGEALLYSTTVYLLWQVFYYVFIWRRRQYKIAHLNYLTSFTYLMSEKKAKTLIYRLSSMLGKQHQLLMFIVWQFIYTIVTVAIAALVLSRSKVVHMFFLAAMVTMSVWNGAGYYLKIIEVKGTLLQPMEKQVESMTKLIEQTKAELQQQQEQPSAAVQTNGVQEAKPVIQQAS
ncbi:hypothetical protein RI367_003398 [Sorochytrium milnesiophthora]